MENVVGFVGCESEDIVWYLSKIITALGKQVAIVDRTEQGMFMELLGIQKEGGNGEREALLCDILVTGGTVCYEEYDVVFLLFGYRLLHPKLHECKNLVMVTDGMPAHASVLKRMEQWNRKQYLVMRDLISMKHTEKYLALLADCEENYCEIAYDEQDTRMRYSLNAYSECKVKQLSYGMRKALVELICFLFPDYQKCVLRSVMRKM